MLALPLSSLDAFGDPLRIRRRNDLSAMPEALAVLSGTPDRARLVEALAAECGEAPEQWLPRFWERLGVPVRPLDEEMP